MRRNKRVKKNSRFATSSMGVASLIVSAFIMLMIFFATNSRCSTITREIGLREKTLQRLDAELTREKTRWDEMKVPERLNIALTRFGLEMKVQKEDQIIRMGRNGVPAPGQLALARLRGTTEPSQRTSVARANVRPYKTSAASRRHAKNGVRK